MSYKILLVDDEPDILEFVGYNLSKEGYTIFKASNGEAAIEIASKEMPHLILLDVMMPEMDGIRCCELLRSNPNLDKCLIAFLSARSEDYSQIAGFDAGADDYIPKPIRPKVLISRVKALLKRHSQEPLKEDQDSIEIDREGYMVVLEGGERVQLPRKEFELLALLISNRGRVYTREEIFHSIWGDDVIVGDRTIDVHIRKLREKIGEHHIVTIKGVGYKFV